MCKYDISLFSAIHESAQGDTYIPTALPSDTSSLACVVTSVTTLPSTSDQTLSTRDSCVTSSSLPVSQPHSHLSSQSDLDVTPRKHILLADPVTLSEYALYIVRLSLLYQPLMYSVMHNILHVKVLS